ncbi:unnamed protein product [Coffea canephora]|uniref:Uncharacterized protein n=1 Tax=Coffea canephora TaxID=49390 RepID=A0A068U811_COFCA|nr:unnamed protein product [Coffea canephora]
MFSSAAALTPPLLGPPPPPAIFFSFFFSFRLLSSSNFLRSPLILKMSFHRLEEVNVGADKADKTLETSGLDPGPGWSDPEVSGGSADDGFWSSEEWLLRRWRGRRTPSEKSSSAERRLGWGKDGFRSIFQNSNSGELESVAVLEVLLLLALVQGESTGGGLVSSSTGSSIIPERNIRYGMVE